MPAARPSPPRTCLVALVRHGQTPTTGKVLPGRLAGLHLSEQGRTEASDAARRLAALTPRPVAVYASPLERAQETAAPIARELGLRVRTDRGLLECDFGQWTGKRLSALARRREWRHVLGAPATFRFPDGESFTDLQARAWDAVVALAERHRGATIVAVSHADPIKAVVAMALGVPLDLFQRTVVSTGSISLVELGRPTPLVHCVNAVGDVTRGVTR